MVFKRIKIVLDLVIVDYLAEMVDPFVQELTIFIAFRIIQKYYHFLHLFSDFPITYHENYLPPLQLKPYHPYLFSFGSLHQIRTCSY